MNIKWDFCPSIPCSLVMEYDKYHRYSVDKKSVALAVIDVVIMQLKLSLGYYYAYIAKYNVYIYNLYSVLEMCSKSKVSSNYVLTI